MLIVDRWSLHVAEIRARMLEYDGRSFPNVVVVIPWNAHDQESVACQIELNETLRKAFPTRLQLPDPRIFRDDIASVDDLRDVIAAALKQTVERLRIDAPTKRSIPPGPTQQPVVQGPVA
ncbi:MAG: hypothetical protein JOZ81_04560 [Chloroflexi bacterium]|nr:hypothetical protein [Chloroflexota bacterium]